jgi:hypothetical protein
MDPTVIVTMLSTAIAALFGALVYTMRQQRDDWKGLFEKERDSHDKTRETSATEARSNAEAIRELADFIKSLPRRKTDAEEPRSERRG